MRNNRLTGISWCNRRQSDNDRPNCSWKPCTALIAMLRERSEHGIRTKESQNECGCDAEGFDSVWKQ